MIRYKLKPLVAAIAVISMPTFAQDDPAGMEEIVVTGFRSSLESALNIKRDSTGSVDSIVAEDIANFPDLNLAESMQRIPGVAINRVAGEGRNISVRGLGPDFTRVRINGMEAMATSGGTDAVGGANRGRGFDFNVFPSDLFSKLTVRKTASADVEEGSLGATVDMDTVRASDFDDFTLSASGQIGYNDLAEESDPRATFLISNMFADGKIGLLFAASYSERNFQDLGASTVRWDNSNDFGSYQGDASAPELTDDINDAFRPRLPRYDSYTHEMERTGLATSLEFLPTDSTAISLDVLYSNHDATRNEIFMQGILNSNGQTNPMDVLSYTLDNTNTLTAASFANATVRSENRYDELSTEFTQATLNLSHDFTDRLRIKAQVGQATSEFDNPIQTTIVGQKTGLTFSYDYSGSNREDPVLVFDNAVGAVTGWSTNSVRLRPLGAENTFDSASFDIEFDLSESLVLKGGLLFKEFEFETFEARRATENDAGVVLNADTMMLFDPGLGSNVWAIPNLPAIAETYNIYSNTGAFVVSPENRLVDNYSASEETQGIYAQLVFNTTVGDTSIRGDFGFRHLTTDQESTAYSASAGDFITGVHDYTETLPSANIVFEPLDNVLIRASYAEVISRAGLDSIRPNVSVSVSGGSRTVSGGNPALEPTRAKTYDLATEIYFNDESMLSLAVFHKDLSTQVQTVSEFKPYTETGLPVELAVAACEAGPGYGEAFGCTENVDWQVNSPTNAPGGPLYGFEASFQQPFTFLPGAFSNLGFIGNFTYVKAQLDYLNSDGEVVATRDLLGLSEDTTSGTLYYDDERFGARISAVNRSSYLTHATGRNGNDREGTNGTTHIDASISYSINDNFSVRFDALNLTNEVEDQWVDAVANRLSYYHETGTQYYLGVQYKY